MSFVFSHPSGVVAAAENAPFVFEASVHALVRVSQHHQSFWLPGRRRVAPPRDTRAVVSGARPTRVEAQRGKRVRRRRVRNHSRKHAAFAADILAADVDVEVTRKDNRVVRPQSQRRGKGLESREFARP